MVARPRSSRPELESGPFLDLACELAAPAADPASRTAVADAVRRLGWAPARIGKHILRLDVAALPRPNTAPRELRRQFLATTTEVRVRKVGELSAMFAHGETGP